jgi:hypothetical protein
VDPEVTRHWVGRYGPYVSAVLAARLTVDRFLTEGSALGGRRAVPTDLPSLAGALDVLRAAVDLAMQADPHPDPDAQAALATALDLLRRAAVTFGYPARHLPAVRELLAQADRYLVRFGNCLERATAHRFAARGQQLRYSDGP